MQNNIFFEFIPLIAFFTLYYITKNIFLATIICIIVTWGQLIATKIITKTVSKKLWLNAILITIFGGIAVLFQNKIFIMVKPTILFGIIGFSIIIGQFFFKKNSIELILSKEISLRKSQWNKLNLIWGIFFVLLGLLNLYVAFNFSEYFWVKFKVFGCLGLMIILTLASAIVINIWHKKNYK